MSKPFNVTKVVQASTVLLKASDPQRISRLRLLKLLYIADRESIKQTGRSITEDCYVAMDQGPVLSHTYNLIRGSEVSTEWDSTIEQVGETGRDVQVKCDTGDDELSLREVEILQCVARQFEGLNDWELVEYTHGFEEWIKNQPPAKSSRTISLDDVLAALNMSGSKERILNEVSAGRAFDEALAEVGAT